jgi:hypothetical protein
MCVCVIFLVLFETATRVRNSSSMIKIKKKEIKKFALFSLNECFSKLKSHLNI